MGYHVSKGQVYVTSRVYCKQLRTPIKAYVHTYIDLGDVSKAVAPKHSLYGWGILVSHNTPAHASQSYAVGITILFISGPPKT